MSDEESVQSIIDLGFPEFAGLFFSVLGTGVGLVAGAYQVLSQDLPNGSAILLSGVTAVVVIGLLLTFYNQIMIQRLKRGKQ